MYLEFNNKLNLWPKDIYIIDVKINEFAQFSSLHIIYEKEDAVYIYGQYFGFCFTIVFWYKINLEIDKLEVCQHKYAWFDTTCWPSVS